MTEERLGVRVRGLSALFPVGRLMSTVTLSRTQFAVSVACFVGLVWLRTDDITQSFWLFGDQILFWNTALLPLHEQPLAGPEQHVGGYALGPGYNWFVWLSRVTFGPFYENLPHAGAIFQVLVHSAVDAFLLWALWRKTGSPWLASVTLLLVTTAPYDLALSATLWNPSLASAAIKGATALVLLGWSEGGLIRVGIVAGIAWVSLHFHVPAVFCVAGVFTALVATPLVRRDYRALARRIGAIGATVALLQVPYFVHRLTAHPDTEAGGAAVTGSLAQVLGGVASIRLVESARGFGRAVDRIQLDPWNVGWIGWIVLVAAIAMAVRHRDDPPLLGVTVGPIIASIVGYAFWVGTFDEYYYLPQMTAVVLTVLIGLSGLAGPSVSRYLGVGMLVLVLGILPARVQQSRTIHRMPEYAALVEGSRQIVRRGAPVRAIRADFLPLGANPEYLFQVLGGRLERNGEWVASIADDGVVSYERVVDGRAGGEPTTR